jgi:hypothetical protein
MQVRPSVSSSGWESSRPIGGYFIFISDDHSGQLVTSVVLTMSRSVSRGRAGQPASSPGCLGPIEAQAARLVRM